MVRRARPLGVLGFATGSRYRVTLADVDVQTGRRRPRRPERSGPGCARSRCSHGRTRPTRIPRSPSRSSSQLTRPHAGGATGRTVLARDEDGDRRVLRCSRPPRTAPPCSTSSSIPLPAGRPAASTSWPTSSGAPWPRHRPTRPSTSGPCRPDRTTTTAPGGTGSSPSATSSRCGSRSPSQRTSSAATRPLVTRPFVPGRDEEAWIDTNNRAFDGHPEQGGWTVEQLRERMAADWVELDGFLVADDPDGPGLIGSCWTKIHRDRDPVLGEIYVIAVDPRHHGQGWGRSLTVAGLESLSAARHRRRDALHRRHQRGGGRACTARSASRVDHVDRSYRRDPSPPRPDAPSGRPRCRWRGRPRR